MKQNEVIFSHSTLWTENGILFVKFSKGLVIDLDLARKIVQDRKSAFGTVYRPIFIDVNGILSIDSPARKYLASSDGCEFLTAGAVYSENKLLEIVGNAWLWLDKPVVPIKIFNHIRAAVEWLELYKPFIQN